MFYVTKQETIDAVKEIYARRIRLIRRAISAAKRARDAGVFCSNFETAIAALQLAEKQTRIDLENQMSYWNEISAGDPVRAG